MVKKNCESLFMDTKTISLDAHRQKYNSLLEEKSINEYLNILSFHELVTESSSIVSEIADGPLTKDITTRSKLILREFSNRLQEESSPLASHIHSTKKKWEERVVGLNSVL